MNLKEIMMTVNSDITKPLNNLINDLSDEEVVLLNSIISKLDNTTYGLSAIKTMLSTVNTNAAKLNNTTYGLSALKTSIDNINTSVNANVQSYPNVTVIYADTDSDVTVTGKGKATLFDTSGSERLTIIIDGVTVSKIPVGVGIVVVMVLVGQIHHALPLRNHL